MSCERPERRRLASASWRRLALVLMALAWSCACTGIETRHRDWVNYQGPGARYFHEEETPVPQGINDPGQPLNRGLFAVNDWLVEWIVSPLSAAYRFVTPRTLRERLGQASNNLAFPTRALNQLAQGQGSSAGRETLRFVVNTTVGLLGLFDPATAWGLPAPLTEDTGQSLAAAGWSDPSYLFLPLAGPETTRDAVGLVGDLATNIGTYLGPVVPLALYFNRGSDPVLSYEQILETEADPYALTHMAWSVLRASQLENTPIEWTGGSSDETLQAVFMKPDDPAFFRTGRSGEALIPATGRALPFSYWLADGTAPLIYVLPGLGSHRLSNQPLAVAQAALEEGWSVVVISSAMHPEFMNAASTAPVPGYAPVDGHDVLVALDAIDRVLAARHGERLGQRALVGISMGAFHALYVAAEQEREPDSGLLHFDLFGAGAPPVSLEYGVGRMGEYYNAPMGWPAGEREARVHATLKRVAALASGDLRPGKQLPFTVPEARFLVGLWFRITLRDVIWNSQQRIDLGVLMTPRDPDDRAPAYREIMEYSWMEYFYAFVLPWVAAEQGVTDAEEALAQCDLRSISPWLARSRRVHVYMSEDDFLRRPEDDALLLELFGERRVHVAEGGAHLGNVWQPGVLEEMLREFRRELLATPPQSGVPPASNAPPQVRHVTPAGV